MNERFKSMVAAYGDSDLQWNDTEVEKFVKLILLKCIGIAEGQALQSTKMANSEFVTPTGRTLYEGMYGGAMNVAAGIRERFDLWDDQ